MQHLLTSWEYKLWILFSSILCSYALSINSGSFLLSFFLFPFDLFPFYFLCRRLFSYMWMSNFLACPYLRFRKYRWKATLCVCVGDRCLSFSWFSGRMPKGNPTNSLKITIASVCSSFYFYFFFRLANFSEKSLFPVFCDSKREFSPFRMWYFSEFFLFFFFLKWHHTLTLS